MFATPRTTLNKLPEVSVIPSVNVTGSGVDALAFSRPHQVEATNRSPVGSQLPN